MCLPVNFWNTFFTEHLWATWEMNHVLQLIQESQIKSKTVMSSSLRKKKEGIFRTVYFAQMNFFKHLRFISMYSVLNTLSEYTSFYMS